jgi:hypothetical protein
MECDEGSKNETWLIGFTRHGSIVLGTAGRDINATRRGIQLKFRNERWHWNTHKINVDCVICGDMKKTVRWKDKKGSFF